MDRKIKCEIYTRVVGYFRPVDQWNKGKQQEFKERTTLKFNENNYKSPLVSPLAVEGLKLQ